MTASCIPVSATTIPSLSQRARNLIHQHGDTSYRCGEWDGNEAGDYNTVHGEASDAEARLVAYVAELEGRLNVGAVKAFLIALDARSAFMAGPRAIGTREDQQAEFDTLGVEVAARLVLDAALATAGAEDLANNGAEREVAARAACVAAGEDPDQMVYPGITMPQGYTKPSGSPRPWWTFKDEASA